MHNMIWLMGLMAMQLHALAQMTSTKDSLKIPPFEGVIGYQIRYEGKVDPASKPYLPDSMTLFVGKNGLLYRYHGGKSAELQSEVLWDGDAQALWLLDPSHKTAESKSDFWTGYVSKPAKLPEKLVVAGKPCSAWTLTFQKQVEKIWVTDSVLFGGAVVDSLKPQLPAFLGSGIRNIPLQSRRTLADGVTTVTKAITILPSPQDKWLFKVPEGYRMREFDPSKLIHPILQPKQE